MPRTLSRPLALAATFGLTLALAGFSAAQSPKDDALDGLLKKLEEKELKSAEAPKAEPAKRESNPSPAPAPAPAAKKAAGDVAGKDKDLDSLLEKLGATEDRPTPEDRRPGGPRGGDEPPQGKAKGKDKQGDPDTGLSDRDKKTDARLEELAGKSRRKKKDQGDDGGGPLAEVIKRMREVEERLGKPDTGEETRKKQTQVVKQIEQLIEEMRNSQSQSKSKKKSMKTAQGKQQPGQQKGDQPGTTGGNAPFTKPQKPTDVRTLAGGKDVWGMLPPEARQELENVAKEGFLLSREELIQQYYLSLTKKKVKRGE